jgi:ankyrin repeat protein
MFLFYIICQHIYIFKHSQLNTYQLVSKIMDVNLNVDNEGHNPLWIAMTGGHVNMVQSIANSGVALHNVGWYACYAAKKRNMPMLQAFGNRALTPNEINGRTALHVAAIKADLNMAIYLVGMGAAINQLDNHGQTPMALADIEMAKATDKNPHQMIINFLANARYNRLFE